MGERRLLVIESQCDQLKPELSFLPYEARQLYEIMIDPTLGQCVPALPDGRGLLIDPSVAEAKDCLRTAFECAARDDATLVIAYIGHGEAVGPAFYLLPKDAKPRPTADTAVDLVRQVRDLHLIGDSSVDGLLVLIDTCRSGAAAFAAADEWIEVLRGTLRFEILVAAEADRSAYEGCFTRALVNLIKEGLVNERSDTLLCKGVAGVIKQRCPLQVPQWLPYSQEKILATKACISQKTWVG
jgi:hypothetical protein